MTRVLACPVQYRGDVTLARGFHANAVRGLLIQEEGDSYVVKNINSWTRKATKKME